MPRRVWGDAVGAAGADGHCRDAQVPRLPGVRLPDAIHVTPDPKIDADIALIAVPTQSDRRHVASRGAARAILVSCAKGIDLATGLGPTALIRRHARCAVAQLTGPSFAVDIAAHLPTALTLACADDDAGRMLQAALSTPELRLYRTTDVVGAELGGALKNVVAIAAGAAIGAGLGDSARAAIIARGFAEMVPGGHGGRCATGNAHGAVRPGRSGADLRIGEIAQLPVRRVAGDRCRDRPGADRRRSPYRAPHRR
jgi:glycerol-3-phosphate dehydrogenase